MFRNTFLCGTIVLALFVIFVQSNDGESGPIIIKTSGKRGRSDLFMIGGKTKCGNGPTIIKESGRKRKHGSDLLFLGGENHCHEKKEIEVKHVPVPYAVKETVHVPVPYKETVHVPQYVPVHVPVHVPVLYKEEKSYGMEMGGYGDMGGLGGQMGGYSGGYARRR